jgi:hypothetical protein
VVGCLAPGSALTVLSDVGVWLDGHTWAHVTAGGVTGWSASEYIVD